jgi:Sec-independent protein translocase protein TatA
MSLVGGLSTEMLVVFLVTLVLFVTERFPSDITAMVVFFGVT